MSEETQVRTTGCQKSHFVKCLPEFFNACLDESKNWSFRKADRDYVTGDQIIKFEWSEATGFTGRILVCTIVAVWGDNMPGIENGYVLLELDPRLKSSVKVQPSSAHLLYQDGQNGNCLLHLG